MQLTIKPNAALSDAAEIDKIIAQIEEDMERLDQGIKSNIPSEVDTSWAKTLKDNWVQYYTHDIPETLTQMGYSSINLRKAVEEAISYDMEKK